MQKQSHKFTNYFHTRDNSDCISDCILCANERRNSQLLKSASKHFKNLYLFLNLFIIVYVYLWFISASELEYVLRTVRSLRFQSEHWTVVVKAVGELLMLLVCESNFMAVAVFSSVCLYFLTRSDHFIRNVYVLYICAYVHSLKWRLKHKNE